MSLPCPRCGSPDLVVRDVRIVLAPAHDERQGLLCWAEAMVGPFHFSGLCVRLSAGEMVVKFPARKDRRGTLHRLITPLDLDLDQRIRVAVVAAYVAERAKRGRREP